MRSLGTVVYAARLADGIIKIGWTEHFERRLHDLKHAVGQDVELLAFKSGAYADEQAIHATLIAHRVPGKLEYYQPHPDVIAVVNAMRCTLGMEPI